VACCYVSPLEKMPLEAGVSASLRLWRCENFTEHTVGSDMRQASHAMGGCMTMGLGSWILTSGMRDIWQ
jgi:hypothetical protein